VLVSPALMRRLVLALLMVVAVSAPARAETPSPSDQDPRSSTSSTVAVPPYPGMTLLVGSRPASNPTSRAKTPVLDRFETYVTSDGYEQVVRFYQAKLGLSPTAAHPKKLAATFPGQVIPSRCQGRRAVFRIVPLPSARSDQSVETRVLGQVLGGTNVVVSDFSVDPRSHQLVDQTSIVILVYR